MLTLRRCLLHPRAMLYAVDARADVGRDVRRGAWPALLALALAGTVFYAASLPGDRTLPLLAATSASWLVFGPALVLLTRRSARTCAHACLVTMAYGVGVLAAATLLPASAAAQASAVALSNVLMAAVLVRQLSALGVPAWRPLAAWTLFLDGPGLLLFRLFGGFDAWA